MCSRNTLTISLLGCLAILLGAAGCDDGSGPQPADVLSGSVQKGAVNDAQLSIAQFSSPGNVLATLVTDVHGDWAMTQPANSSAPYVMSASGGTYEDEKTGAVVTIPSTMAMYGFIPPGGRSGQVNPLTHALYLAVAAKTGKGKSPSKAIEEVLAGVTDFGFDPATDRPDKNGTEAQKQYAALLGGFSYLADDVITNDAIFDNSHRFQIVMAIARDISDGYLDALDIAGNPIVVDLGVATRGLPVLDDDGIGRLINCANNYVQNEPALAGVVVEPVVANVVDGNGDPLSGLRVLATNKIPCEFTLDCPVRATSGAARTERFTRPTTTIRYEVQDTSNVDLSVYDIDGVHVRTIVDQRQQPGSWTVFWDGLDDDSVGVITGVYEFRLTASNDVATLFESSSYGILYVVDIQQDGDLFGTTDVEGMVSSAARKRFPYLVDNLPMLQAIDPQCNQFGTISYTDSVVISVTDDPITEYQRYRRTIRDGLNRFRLVYDSPMPGFASGVAGEEVRERGVKAVVRVGVGSSATWRIESPCPSPFN